MSENLKKAIPAIIIAVLFIGLLAWKYVFHKEDQAAAPATATAQSQDSGTTGVSSSAFGKMKAD